MLDGLKDWLANSALQDFVLLTPYLIDLALTG